MSEENKGFVYILYKKGLFSSNLLSFEEDFSHGSPLLKCLRFHCFSPNLYCLLCVCIQLVQYAVFMQGW